MSDSFIKIMIAETHGSVIEKIPKLYHWSVLELGVPDSALESE